MVLARRMAHKKVEMMLKAQGLNPGTEPQRMERKAIMATADAYLVEHRNELFRTRTLLSGGMQKVCSDREEVSEILSAGRAKTAVKSRSDPSNCRPSNND